jgi:transcriptional regulator with XRE-family HTH domain
MPRDLLSPRYQRLRQLVRDARKKSGLTQLAVAQALGRPQSYVADFERRERRLDVIEFLAFADAIDFDPSELLAEVRRVRERPGRR